LWRTCRKIQAAKLYLVFAQSEGDRVNLSTPQRLAANAALDEIEQLDRDLHRRFQDRLITEPLLTRQLVSFQANKAKPIYRWYKYKEAFSAALVEYLLTLGGVTTGAVLDPFAGSGTALFAASELGLDADGIELLPIGQEIIATKKIVETELTAAHLAAINTWIETKPWQYSDRRVDLPELRISRGAYPPATQAAIEHYVAAYQNEPDPVRAVLHFALLCVLEEVSYTRKDGQYLRWDARSSRRQGARPFNKGIIPSFEQAITDKLAQMVTDLQQIPLQPALFADIDLPSTTQEQRGAIHVFDGSCLDILPQLPAHTYDAIITSPPYCNRYDYTRTYALELALLGTDEQKIVQLRQAMLSCTVENRAKNLLAMHPGWDKAIAAADRQPLLRRILAYLDDQNKQGLLNNTGIARMVRGYFYELACVIAECSRVLRPGAPLLMVNDNVRYAGAAISADTILSAIAEELGFHTEKILVLPNGKGNSSQQMGAHGRQELRKCVYIWRRQ
jgi:DNA modification methylase